MEIIIENLSSPGAQFSKNTNEVMLKIFSWINDNNCPKLQFIDFRRGLERDVKINDNNARNIYPLLKNSGLVEYQGGEVLDTASFFTKRGLAYINALQMIESIEQGDYTKKQKEQALNEVNIILGIITFDSVAKLIKNDDLNYSEGLKWYIQYLTKFGKINKEEFALMVHTMAENPNTWYDEIKENISKYRNGDVDINVKVRVRNDQKIQKSTGQQTRLEGISFFTAYTYYAALVNQAAITRKVKDYQVIVDGMTEKLEILFEED